MFDPTIYDNLKVVFEGALYDLDEERRVRVTGREDLVDLAGMSRTFRMQVRRPEGCCTATLELQSGILDFAGELRRIRLADELPGCALTITFDLPEDKVAHGQALHGSLEGIWGEVASIRHELTRVLNPQPPVKDSEDECETFWTEGRYRITLDFLGKIDEDNIGDVEPLLEHFVSTLEQLEGNLDD